MSRPTALAAPYRELTGREPPSQAEIIALLSMLSAADCLLWLARLEAQLVPAPDRGVREGLQHRLIASMVGDGDLGAALHRAIDDPRWSSVFCEQQVVHLARPVILHADQRPHDDFGNGALLGRVVHPRAGDQRRPRCRPSDRGPRQPAGMGDPGTAS
jgi:hypothetical protein